MVKSTLEGFFKGSLFYIFSLLGIVWGISILPVFGQDTLHLYGKITDTKTGEPLTGVAVTVSAKKLGGYSDARGVYTLTLPKGKHVIRFSCIGYEEKEVSIVLSTSSKELNLSLDAREDKLGAVTVVGKSRGQLVREAPHAVSVVDVKALVGKSQDLADILDRTVGVKALKQGGLGSSQRIIVQGLDGKRISLFLNGVPIGNAEGFDLGAIPIDLIERVEVYKGVVPARLGGDGLGGAINIVMQERSRDYLGASYQIGSYHTHQAHLAGSKKLGNSGVSLSANGLFNYSKNNYSFMSPFEQGRKIYRDHDRFRHYGLGGGVSSTSWGLDYFSLGVNYDKLYKEIQGGMMNIQNNVQHAHTKVSTLAATLALSKDFLDKKLSISSYTRFAYALHRNVDTSFYAYDFIGNRYDSPSIQGEVGPYPRDSHDRALHVSEQLNLAYTINPQHALLWNTTYRFSQKKIQDELADKYSAFSISGLPNSIHAFITGLTHQWTLAEGKVVNELGGKFYYYKGTVVPAQNIFQKELMITHSEKASATWCEAVSWHISPALTLKGSVQSAVRIPNEDESFGDGLMITPSKALKPEVSYNANLGIEGLFAISEYPYFKVSGNLFYMHISNLIKLMMTSAVNMQYANIDKVRSMGVEVECMAGLLPWLDVKGNIAYHDVRDIRKDAVGGGVNYHYLYRVPNTPYFFGYAEAKVHGKNLLGRHSLSEGFVSLDFTDRFSYNWQSKGNNNLVIPRKWNLNVGIQHSINERYHLSFEVHNLLGTEQWAEYRYPLPGRTFHIKLRLTL